MPENPEPAPDATAVATQRTIAALEAERAGLTRRNESNTARIAVIDVQLAALKAPAK